MAEKKFYPIDASLSTDTLSADYRDSVPVGKVNLGKTGIFYKDGFKTRYAAYSGIEQAFIRVNEVNGKLCCGKASFYYYRLILVSQGKEYIAAMTENLPELEEVLSRLPALAPEIKIGK